MRCPACGTPNRRDMTFCYECGEPLDGSVRPPAGPPDAGDEAPPAAGRFPRWEVLIGVALVILVGAIAGVTGWLDAGRAEQHRIYDQAQAALANGDKVTALDAFARAGTYADAPAQADRLRPEVARLRNDVSAATTAAADGAWWDAAHGLAAASAIQVSYQDVVTRLQQARTQSGPLFFRAPAPDGQPALWAAQADGGEVHRLPHSGAESALLGLAPDDRWAVYSGATLSDTLRAGPYLLDLTTGQVTPLGQPFRTLSALPWVGFRADSKGFWWGAGRQAYYYDLERASALPLSEVPGAFDLANGRVLLNRLLLPAIDQMHSRLLLADPLGANRIPLADEPGEVLGTAFSDDGRYLVYTQVSLPAPDAAGRLVVTTTLVLTDLDTPDGPQRVVLDSRQDRREDAAAVSLRATFVPGTHTVLALTRDSSRWTLRAWPTGGSPSLLVEGTAEAGAGLAGVQGVPGGAAVAARFAGAHDGPVGALLIALGGGQTLLGAPLPGSRWLTFAPDGRAAVVIRSDPGAADGAVLDLSDPGDARPAVRASYPLPATPLALASGQTPAFTRDSRRLLLLGDFGSGAGLYAVRPTGGEPILVAAGATAFWTGRDPAPLLFGP